MQDLFFVLRRFALNVLGRLDFVPPLLVRFVIGFVFVIITVSVMLQVTYFKLTDGRRLLRMAPLQHHLELIGWHENQITQRFWIVSMLAGVAGLALAFS